MKKHKQKEVGFQAKEKNQERNKNRVASEKEKEKKKVFTKERGFSHKHFSRCIVFLGLGQKCTHLSL